MKEEKDQEESEKQTGLSKEVKSRSEKTTKRGPKAVEQCPILEGQGSRQQA